MLMAAPKFGCRVYNHVRKSTKELGSNDDMLHHPLKELLPEKNWGQCNNKSRSRSRLYAMD